MGGVVQFMITFNHIEGEWERLSDEEREGHDKTLERFVAELAAEKGAKLVFMTPVEQRKTVRKHRDGSYEVSDGPYLEASEHPGGYYIIEAEDWDEAVEWARRGRFLCGSNEVRQIFSF